MKFGSILLLWTLFVSLVAGGTALAAEDVYYYHTDTAGTPLAMSNATGQKVWEADYKPFGEEYSVSGTKESDRRFVGKEKDEETGLNYFGARYLGASTGRFLAPDPVRAVSEMDGKINTKFMTEPQRHNLYGYSFNNPYKFHDPDGLDIYHVSWATSYFLGSIGGRQVGKNPRGMGTQAGYGVAFDTQDLSFHVFATGGNVDKNRDVVVGAGAGLGVSFGGLKGDLADFWGESREKTDNYFLFTTTDVKTSNGKQGWTYSVGGKGFGLGSVSITTDTFDFFERGSEVWKKYKDESKVNNKK